jgi:RNA polymerase sigma-70 factor (ECF subfamily)
VLLPPTDEKAKPMTEIKLDADQTRADSVDKLVPERTSSGCAGIETCETSTELSARFVHDVIPLVDQMYGAARRMTHSHADAEDLLQDTMLRAYVGFRSFRRGTNLRAWLFQIMGNTRINAYRKTERRPQEYLNGEITDSELLTHSRHAPLGLRSAEVEAMEVLVNHEITEALAALPDALRLVVHYADVEGHRYAQVAEIMNIPVGTVMSRMHRARRQLRLRLADVAHERGLLGARIGDETPNSTYPEGS